MIEVKFDVIGITETKIKTTNPAVDTNINVYKCYSAPTEADKGGALLYIDGQYNANPLPNIDQLFINENNLNLCLLKFAISK